MLETLNRYCHGYVAVPVIMVLKSGGFFELLEKEGPLPAKTIANRLKINEGHLMVALRLLHCSNWLSSDEFGVYALSATAEIHRKILPTILELYQFPFDKYIKGNEHSLQPWFNDSDDWHKSLPSQWADILDGVVLVPLLIALHIQLKSQSDIGQPILSELDPSVYSELSRFLIKKKWCDVKDEKLYLNPVGKLLVDQALNMEVVTSYRPLLAKMSELLFGNVKQTFEREDYGIEKHIGGTLNVFENGFQHCEHFAEMETMVVEIFNCVRFENQPNCIVHYGCGDGTLLRNLHKKICANTLRGRRIDTQPVTLIGVDYSREALNVAKETLKDLTHKLFIGDISKPQQILDQLLAHEITADKILHVRFFRDHDRHFIYPENSHELRNDIPCHGAFVDNDGTSIPPAVMVQNLVEHFQKWTKVLGPHGLLVLEAHCLDPVICQDYLDKCENVYFDALQGFSKKYLVDADTFHMAAAEAGLFPKIGSLRSHPKHFPFTRITLSHFEKRNYTVRYATLTDLPSLADLESQCWGPKLCSSSNEIQARIIKYPQGQCVVVRDGMILGVSYTQRIVNVEDLNNKNYRNVGTLHDPKGSAIQLLAINILPSAQNQGLGDTLLDFMLQRYSLIDGIDRVVGITKCSSYSKHAHLKYEDYISTCNAFGLLLDPVLNFHKSHGAQIIRAIPNYRPEDEKNLGYGVLIQYSIKRQF